MPEKKDGAEVEKPEPAKEGETKKVDTGAQEDAAKERGKSGGYD